MRIVAFTGHRPNKLGNDYQLTSPFVVGIQQKIIEALRLYDPSERNKMEFITGMAQGIDQLVARIAIHYKVPFTAAIPCEGQEKMWAWHSQQEYLGMLLLAKEVFQVSNEPYSPWLMQKRNEWMVDNCTDLIAVWDGTKGGTHNCIKYAEKIHKPIHIIRI